MLALATPTTACDLGAASEGVAAVRAAAYASHVLACPNCGRENPDEASFCMACATPLTPATPAREVRKTVTVLFCDLVGSTTLAERHDPEILRPLLQRYFTEARAAIERHGGLVEKFIGDAVVAIFGMPRTHEDDALRAVRAAVEIRERLASLGADAPVELGCRIGLTTGEVLVGREDQPPIGDTMNTAARLESAAEPGEILIGETTYRLVQDAVVAEPVEPLALKGKSEAVPAFRLLQVASLSPMRTRHLDAPMVGRTRERVLLEQAFERAVSDRDCQLFTVLGAAGAGKSRLVEEFLSGLDEGLVLSGRCLPYGDGITYFPVVGAMKEALGIADFDDESSVRESIHAAVAGQDHADAIAANLAKLLGAGEGGAPEETFWAIRRFLEVRERINRSWSCSTTSTGGNRHSWTWWSTSPTGPGTLRSCSCAWRGPICSTSVRDGPEARRTRRRSRSRRSPRPSAPS